MRLTGGCSVLVARLSVDGETASLDNQVTKIEFHSIIVQYKERRTSSNIIEKQIITKYNIIIN